MKARIKLATYEYEINKEYKAYSLPDRFKYFGETYRIGVRYKMVEACALTLPIEYILWSNYSKRTVEHYD